MFNAFKEGEQIKDSVDEVGMQESGKAVQFLSQLILARVIKVQFMECRQNLDYFCTHCFRQRDMNFAKCDVFTDARMRCCHAEIQEQ